MKTWQILLLCILVVSSLYLYNQYDAFYDYTFNADQARRNASDWGGKDYTRKDPITGRVTEVSSGHLDPRCPRGQYSKKTGGLCSGPALPDSPSGTYEPGAGNYDRNPNKPDSVDYTDTDVLTNPGKITYPDWITNRASSSFRPIYDSSDISSSKPDKPDFEDSTDSKWDAIRELNLKNSRESNMDSVRELNSRESPTEIAYSNIKKGRPSANDFIKESSRRNRYKAKPQWYREQYDRRERQFDLPSKSKYEDNETRGYRDSCNLKSYNSNEDNEDNECCE